MIGTSTQHVDGGSPAKQASASASQNLAPASPAASKMMSSSVEASPSKNGAGPNDANKMPPRYHRIFQVGHRVDSLNDYAIAARYF